ncbi:ABC transporter ATP-binding protein [Halomonas cibimaris]|uniref:ABC transporter ATP-binding protein n=1 Tax=Halomonas cibimaris TaxID=657012 RepID=A0ABP7LDU4_9GAMM
MCSDASGVPEKREDIAIRLVGVSKHYRLYPSTQARLKEWVWRPLKRRLGREASPYYRNFTALDSISVELPKGHTTGIIGRNGSGKSTLLQLICGTLQPSEGRVEVNGRIAALLELGAGFNPEFTGRENIFIYAAIMGLSRAQAEKRFTDIVAFADIGAFIEQPVKAYSSGMLVRLAFAVIAHVDADILIIDEALAVGDAFFVQKCMRFLRRFMEQGTVLFVSHDSAAVTSLCDHAIWLDQGSLRMQGSAKALTEHYLAARYAEENASKAAPVPAVTAAAETNIPSPMPAPLDYHDARKSLINASPWRNDLEVFAFKESQNSFGQGGGSISHVALRDAQGQPLRWVVGGEPVSLHVVCTAHLSMDGPIVGFLFKDRLGQTLFGDNTFLTHSELSVEAGQNFEAEFTFVMPTLPQGQYSIALALAEGSQQDHVQHQWIHDALLVESHSSSESTGLVGIPMHHISLQASHAQPAPRATATRSSS